MGNENGGVGALEILGQTLYGGILIKEWRRQIQLIGLIELIGKRREGD